MLTLKAKLSCLSVAGSNNSTQSAGNVGGNSTRAAARWAGTLGDFISQENVTGNSLHLLAIVFESKKCQLTTLQASATSLPSSPSPPSSPNTNARISSIHGVSSYPLEVSSEKASFKAWIVSFGL